MGGYSESSDVAGRGYNATAALIGGVGLLERAINYTLGSLHGVEVGALHRRTPCPDWDLRALLAHLDDSFTALSEAIDVGEIGLDPAPSAPCADPVAALRDRASRLLGAWTSAGDQLIRIGGSPITAGIVTGTGAIEIAVHGWDIARACGHDRPLPTTLAEEMLDLAVLLITEADRPARFAARIKLSPGAAPPDHLLAFLGRPPPGTSSDLGNWW